MQNNNYLKIINIFEKYLLFRIWNSTKNQWWILLRSLTHLTEYICGFDLMGFEIKLSS